MTDNNRNPSKTWLVVLAGVLVIGLCAGKILISTLGNLSVFIEPNERGIVLAPEPTGEILEPGYHLLSINERVVLFNIGRETYVMSADNSEAPDFVEGKTSDGRKVQADISVVYAVDPNHVLDLYRTWQDRYRDGVVRPMSRSITHNTLEQYTIDEILERQDEIEKAVTDQLKTSLAENYLLLVEYNFLDIRQANP